MRLVKLLWVWILKFADILHMHPNTNLFLILPVDYMKGMVARNTSPSRGLKYATKNLENHFQPF